MMNARVVLASSVLLAVCTWTAGVARAGDTGAGLTIVPAEIRAGLSYSGTTVRIEADVPENHDVIIVCEGHAGPVELKKKGKVFGFLWMNVGELVYEHVPSLYVLASSAKLEPLAPPETLQELGVGYAALAGRNLQSGDDAEQRRLFGELIKLKEHEKLFAVLEGAVRLEAREGGIVHASAECWLPAKTPPGHYQVRLYGFKEGQGRLAHSGELEIRQVGLAAAIVGLSRERGLLYCVVAVIIALTVGLLTGLVFGLGARRRR
jgi:uncharacterized protein (TIGR02186 family)